METRNITWNGETINVGFQIMHDPEEDTNVGYEIGIEEIYWNEIDVSDLLKYDYENIESLVIEKLNEL